MIRFQADADLNHFASFIQQHHSPGVIVVP
jgi:hypothetical protein